MATEKDFDDHPRGNGSLPLLLKAECAARFLGFSKSEFYRLNTTGRIPSPIRFGRVMRWPRAVLRRWTEAGCPPRHEWETNQ